MNCSPPGFSVHGIFFRQEYWSGLPFPSPGDLPNPGIEPRSPALQADSSPSESPGKPLTFFWMPLWGVTGLFWQSSSLHSESSKPDWARGGRTLGILIIIWTWSTTHLHGDALPYPRRYQECPAYHPHPLPLCSGSLPGPGQKRMKVEKWGGTGLSREAGCGSHLRKLFPRKGSL